ncbi:MAG: toll/interleukin-1 receptor domain-containing protein [Tildeniella nuda ZEHNDER 1965/U140]|jgi:hypothetical protein|nr:toll/interleukin-1 receptor domain-containing protein [Tildeniella nuda ZEHNDER 1965/U140]
MEKDDLLRAMKESYNMLIKAKEAKCQEEIETARIEERKILLDAMLEIFQGDSSLSETSNVLNALSEILLASKPSKEVFISYAWGDEREAFVNRLDASLQEKGITIIRDKREVVYKESIQSFMERIGRGKCVIAVISDKYLRSPNCMFELVQVSKNGKFHDRIFPIVLSDADIYKPIQRIKYIKHWEDETKALDEAMRGVSAAHLQGFRDEIDQYTEIRNTIAALTDIFKNMNTLTPDLHSQDDFEALFTAIERRLNA